MNRLFLGLAVVGWIALASGSMTQAQSRITYRDDGKNVEVGGTIKTESAAKVILKPNIGAERTIPSIEISDIFYEVKLDIRQDYRRANTAEHFTAPKAKVGSAAYRDALNDALGHYQKLIDRARTDPKVARHFQYKIANLSARLARDDREKEKAIQLLEGFQTQHADSWQIHNCVKTLSEFYLELGQLDKAVTAFDKIIKSPGVPAATVADLELKSAEILVRAKKHAEAGARLERILRTMPNTNPRYNELRMQLIICKANTPAKFQEAVGELRKMISTAKEPAQIALAHNTLGNCYLMNNQPKDAVYEYLYVDLIHNQDRDQHLKAVAQLVQVFKELRQPDRAREYAEKLDKMSK